MSEFHEWLKECGVPDPYYVYRFYAVDDTLLYVGITWNLRNRMYAHYHSKPWIDQVVNIDYETVPDEQAARARETELITTQRPVFNRSQNEEVAEVVRYLQRLYEERGCEQVMQTMDHLVEEEEEE